ncbi:MAG: hypothetical protein Q9218_001456 [Villophora microphyllina]
MPQVNQKALNIWTARIIPLVLAGIVGYSTWVIIVLVCVDYLLKPAATVRKPRRGAGIAILIIYDCLLLLLALTYFRLVHTVVSNPGYTPRGPQWHAQNSRKRRHDPSGQAGPGHSESEKRNGVPGAHSAPNGGLQPSPYVHPSYAYGPADDVPTPSLQEFYMRDVFSCESDGRPIWCSTCLNWKPDRAHHCREVGRCVRKMDHFCPWVGGVVSERSQKFFVLFVVWGAIYCMFAMIFMANASLFSLFLIGMSGSSLQFVFQNSTTIENLSRRTKVWQLAVYMPNPPQDGKPQPFRTITYGGQPQLPPDPSQLPPRQPAGPIRTFAILHSRPGENIWDLGYFRNFKAVMGEQWYHWFLPIRHSPCAKHDRLDCEFETGPVVERMKREAGILTPNPMALEEKPHRSRRRRRRRSRHGSGTDGEEGHSEKKRHRRRHRRPRDHDALQGNGVVA